MRIQRHYTTDGRSPYDSIAFRTATSEIRNPDGSVVFRLADIAVPAAWSQVAADIIAQKYFRKAGVPARLKRVEENAVPSWLWRSEPDLDALAALPEGERTVSESDARQVFDRLAGTWTYWGWKGGYFSSEEDARAFFDELRFMLASQMAAGLRHRRPEPGASLRRPVDEGARPVDHRLRASAAARLLHPVRLRRPRQRGRYHGSVGARGAAVQIRLRHGLQLLAPPRRGGKTFWRR
jgi:hypothetical protein